MTRIYATAIFTMQESDIQVDRLQKLASNDLTPADWTAHVEGCYKAGLRMALNKFYERNIKVRHLAAAGFDAPPPIGRVWSDWVVLTNERLGTSSLHASFNFLGLEADITNPSCPGIAAVAAYLADWYQLGEAVTKVLGATPALSDYLGEFPNKRDNALGLSRYMFVSVLTEQDHVKEPSDAVKINLYRLLYLHSVGVDRTTADDKRLTPWQGAEFFRLYCQPGAIVSIASPYPRSRNVDWFDCVNPPELARPPAGWQGGMTDPEYDLLPEYPPLRHLGLAIMEYVAVHEETTRAMHDLVFKAESPNLNQWVRAFFKRKLKNKRKRSMAELHLLSGNLEGIRLPVSRSFVNSLLELQLQSRTISATMDQIRASNSKRARKFTVIALLVSIFALLVSILNALVGIFSVVSPHLDRRQSREDFMSAKPPQILQPVTPAPLPQVPHSSAPKSG